MVNKLKDTVEVTLFLGHDKSLSEHANSLARKNVHDRKHLSRQEFKEKFGVSDFNKVESWAKKFDLTVNETHKSSRIAKIEGKLADLEKAFNVKFTKKDGFRVFSGDVTVPSFAQSVHGLSDKPIAKPHFRPSANPNQLLSNMVASAYKFPNGNGAGQTIAIIELGGGYSQNDLTSYFTRVVKVQAPQVISVSVDGAVNQYGDPSGADIEVELDIEIPGSIANQAKYVVYFAPNTDKGFIDAITQAAHDTTNNPSVISISWGGPEQSWPQASIQAMNQAFQAASVLGVTVFAASGDNGNTDGASGLNVDYPASDPFVCGCGGTDITSIAPLVEDGWSGAGGGASSIFPVPTWQQQTVSGATKRSVPDVAGLAGSPGFTVVADGRLGPVEGTSCVAPLWASLIAIINGNLGKNVGFINPLIYQAGEASGAFQDITNGNNGFPCGPGWDPVTGLGSPNGQALLTALQSETQQPSTVVVPSSLSYHVQENVAMYLTLKASDNISGATGVSFGVITPPQQGTLTPASGSTAFTSTMFYTPNNNFVGNDLFTYQASDNTNGTKSNTGTINLVVAGQTVAQTRYQLRSTQKKGEPIPDSGWKINFDSGVLQ